MHRTRKSSIEDQLKNQIVKVDGRISEFQYVKSTPALASKLKLNIGSQSRKDVKKSARKYKYGPVVSAI